MPIAIGIGSSLSTIAIGREQKPPFFGGFCVMKTTLDNIFFKNLSLISIILASYFIMRHIAIFASGSGTNAKKIIEYFVHSEKIKISLVVSNKVDAGVLQVAKDFGLPSLVIDKYQLANESLMTSLLEKHKVEYIILAGFLLLIPVFLVRNFEKRIVNIHPALLPNYGGKGMYGRHVHEAVYKNKEHESGISIHFASDQYDEGDIIFQKSIAINEGDTPEIIAQKVQQLEHQFFPKVIEELILKSI